MTLRITSVVAAILAGVFIVFPVIYGVRSDKEVFLFSIKPEFQSDLDNGTLSEELRKEFEGSYGPLPQNMAVRVKEAGSEWIIADETDKLGKCSYSIIKADSDLRIYGTIEQFLDSPSAREKFEKEFDKKTKTGVSQESPLVKQAEAFALYLNPIKQAAFQKVPKGAKPPNIASKVKVSPQFTVLATIVYPDDPTLSQVLINEPGTGRHWVRQSTMVGHLFVEEVKDGLVVLKSGDEIQNLAISEKAETESTGKPSTAPSLRNSQSSTKPKSTAFSRAASNVTRTRNIPARTQKSPSDEKRVDELVDKLKDLQQQSVTNDDDSDIDPEEQEQRKARIQELISKFKSTSVSAEESEKLDNMGEELNDIEEDPNSSSNNADKSEGKVSPSKPDDSEEE